MHLNDCPLVPYTPVDEAAAQQIREEYKKQSKLTRSSLEKLVKDLDWKGYFLQGFFGADRDIQIASEEFSNRALVLLGRPVNHVGEETEILDIKGLTTRKIVMMKIPLNILMEHKVPKEVEFNFRRFGYNSVMNKQFPWESHEDYVKPYEVAVVEGLPAIEYK